MTALLVNQDAGTEYAPTQGPPASVVTLHNNIMHMLQKHYPHVAAGWSIAIDLEGGVVQIRNLMLSGKMGFVMKIRQIAGDFKNVVAAGGELLERYRIARDHAVDIRDQLNNAQRSPLGDYTYDK